MMWLFALGWLAGVVSALLFGKWIADKKALEMLDKAIEERKNENRTKPSV